MLMQQRMIVFSIFLASSCVSFGIAHTATAQQIIKPPAVVPFNDNKNWMLAKDLTYVVGETDLKIVVPGGFVTDFASTPKPLWSLSLSPHEKYSKAAIVHDYLYWTHICTREQADNILMIAMKESGVPYVQRETVYAGVREGGASAWNANAVERSKGLPRVIPSQFQEFPGDVSWEEYRAALVKQHQVNDPTFPTSESYCALGNATDVPR
jgi:uncharacterized protein DUF1353